MKVLVVGGTGLIGGAIALHLQQQGHSVTLMSRSPTSVPGLADMPFMPCDYINDDVSDGRLAGFDWLVFSAAADIRNIPTDGSVTPEAFYAQANDVAVPRFFAAARDAGIQRAVMIGTFYPRVAPQQIGVCPYVTSRHNTDVAVRALASDTFAVSTLSAPFVLGRIPGLDIPYIDGLVQYVKGNIPGLPLFAPAGGTNHITTGSLAQAALNVLENGESGKEYLVGDKNYSWKEYLELWSKAAGNPMEFEVRDDDHPMFPNVIMFAGAGVTVSYEPDAADMAVLNYDRDQVAATIQEIANGSQ